MILSKRHILILLVLVALIPIFSILHIFSGQIDITFTDFSNSILDYDPQNTLEYISREIRLPRLFMAIIAGAGLSLAGLLMQTLFNNPLAGPYVLGINSGASLFVALTLMTGISVFATDIGIVTGALLGAFLFGLIILGFSIKIKSHISLLLVGLMLGSFTSALVFIIQSSSTANDLKAFTMWAMGSLQGVNLNQIPYIGFLFMLGIIGSLFIIKPLSILVIGENDAKLLGVHYKFIRLIIISITALLTGVITAYCGPIAFVGLAVPNLVKIIFKTQSHLVLLLACLLIGALFMLGCDIIIQLIESRVLLPINAVTSLIGAPFVVFIVLKRLR